MRIPGTRLSRQNNAKLCTATRTERDDKWKRERQAGNWTGKLCHANQRHLRVSIAEALKLRSPASTSAGFCFHMQLRHPRNRRRFRFVNWLDANLWIIPGRVASEHQQEQNRSRRSFCNFSVLFFSAPSFLYVSLHSNCTTLISKSSPF